MHAINTIAFINVIATMAPISALLMELSEVIPLQLLALLQYCLQRYIPSELRTREQRSYREQRPLHQANLSYSHFFAGKYH